MFGDQGLVPWPLALGGLAPGGVEGQGAPELAGGTLPARPGIPLHGHHGIPGAVTEQVLRSGAWGCGGPADTTRVASRPASA